MPDGWPGPLPRRAWLAAAGAGVAQALSGCASAPRVSGSSGPKECPADPRPATARRAPLPADVWPAQGLATPAAPMPAAAALDAQFERILQRLPGAPSIDAALLQPGVGRWQRRGGWFDRPAGVPLTADAPFWWASCSKAVTATLVLQAERAGLLALDDPVSRWRPDLPRADRLQVQHLLRHTSHLVSYNAPSLGGDVTRDPYRRPDELLALAVPASQGGCPGTAFSYSNTGYLVLALILEAVWQQPYHRLVADRIAAPHGLALRALPPADPAADVVRQHGADGHVRPSTGLASLKGAGDVVGSAAAMAGFWHAVLDGRLAGAPQPRWEPMLDMGLATAQGRLWYGIGTMAMDWRDARGRERLWLGHTGGAQDGGNAVVLWDPLLRVHAAVAVGGPVSAVAVANALLQAFEGGG